MLAQHPAREVGVDVDVRHLRHQVFVARVGMLVHDRHGQLAQHVDAIRSDLAPRVEVPTATDRPVSSVDVQVGDLDGRTGRILRGAGFRVTVRFELAERDFQRVRDPLLAPLRANVDFKRLISELEQGGATIANRYRE